MRTITTTISMTSVYDGENGGNTAVVMLFQRGTAIPAVPAVTLTYTFATRTLSGGSLNGWTQDMPAHRDGTKIYVTCATAYSTEKTDEIAPNEWTAPVEYVADGLNTATVFIYKRATAKPDTTDRPLSKATYTFESGQLAMTNANGWSHEIPNATSDRKPCWVRQATAASTGATDDIETTEWSDNAMKLVQDGENSIRLDLTNNNDTMLYDGAGNLLSGSVTSQAILYDGISPVYSGVTFSIDDSAGCYATISGSVITVSGMTAATGYVTVRAAYNGKYYYDTLSLKRISGVDKFDLYVTPNAIPYNTSETFTDKTVSVQVYRTPDNGGARSLVTFRDGANDYNLTLSTSPSLTETTGSSSTTTRTFTVTGDDVSGDNIVITLYKGGEVQDAETLPVTKARNGRDSIRIDLTNQADLISCDSNGYVRYARTIRTTARIYDGGKLVTSGVTIPEGMKLSDYALAGKNPASIDIANGELPLAWAFAATDRLTAASYTASIVLRYNNADYTVVFSLAKTDMTAVYNVQPDPSGISFAYDSANKQLTPAYVDLVFRYTKETGSGTTSSAVTAFGNIDNAGLYPYYRVKSGGTWGSWTAWNISYLRVQKSTLATDYEICLSTASAASGVTDNNIHDREEIPVVKDGEDGDNSVVYSIIVEKEIIENDGSDSYIWVRVLRTDGDSRTEIDLPNIGDYGLTITGNGTGSMADAELEQVNDSQLNLEGLTTPITGTYILRLLEGSNVLDTKTIIPKPQNGTPGRRGPALRVSDWNKCTNDGTTGYQFYEGAENEPFKDVVVYVSGGTEYWFSCVKSHATVQPPKITGNYKTTYWEGTTRQEIVATNVLLATYGKIENLYTDDIRIGDWENKVGNYFIAQAGKVETNFGVFKNITVEDADVTGTLRAQKYLQRIDEITFTSDMSYYDIPDTKFGNYVQTLLATSIKVGSRTYNQVTLPHVSAYTGCFVTLYNTKISEVAEGVDLIPLRVYTKYLTDSTTTRESFYNASNRTLEEYASLPVGQVMRLYSDGTVWWILERTNIDESTGGGQAVTWNTLPDNPFNGYVPNNFAQTVTVNNVTGTVSNGGVRITIPTGGGGSDIDWGDVAIKIGNSYIDFDSALSNYAHVADITDYVGGGGSTTITVSYDDVDGKYGTISDGTRSFSWYDQTYMLNHFATANHTHSYLPLSGGTMTGNILMDGHRLSLGGGQLGGAHFDMFDGKSNAPSGYEDCLYFSLGEGAYFDNDITIDGTVNQTSDIRLKKKINVLTPGIDTFADAPLFSFSWKSGKGKPVNVGTAAQHFQRALPEVVTEGKDGYLRLDYNGMNTAGVITAAREIVALKKDAEEKDRRIEELERKLKEIMDKL